MAVARDPVQSTLRRLVWATVGLYLVVIVMVGVVYGIDAHQRDQIRDVAFRTNTALCALRSDLEARTAQSKKFLEDHPNGIPGISAADIQQGIVNQERTIRALAPLVC